MNIYLPQIFKSHLRVGIDRGYKWLTPVIAANINSLDVQYHNGGGIDWWDYQRDQYSYNTTCLEEARERLRWIKAQSMLTINGMPSWAEELPTREMIYYLRGFVAQVSQIPLCTLQIWNEVDSKDGMDGIFGLWGLPKLDLYIEILRGLQDFRRLVPLSVGLMMIDGDTWPEEFAKKGGFDLVDQVNFHYYCYWGPGATQDDLWPGIHGLSKPTYKLASLTDKPLHLTETCLLSKYDTTEEYESLKAWWTREIYHQAQKLPIKSVWYFTYQSNWEGANFWDTPAWDVIWELA